MPSTASPTTAAIMIGLAGTFAILAFAFLSAITSTRPVRARAHLTGRAASPYRYSPSRLEDELGSTPAPAQLP